MDDEVAQKFINSVVKNLQVLCHSNVDFNKNVEVIGHLYLNVDSCTKLNYIVNEKVCRNESSSTVFVSNSFHAEVGVKKKEKEQSMKNTNEMSPRLQRSQSRDDFPRRQSTDVNNTKRDHQGHYPPEPKIPRLSDPGGHSESRQSSTYRSPFSPNSRSRHSQETSNSVQKSPIEIDLTKVKKEFISGSSSGGCDMDGGGGNNDPSSRTGSTSFTTETDSIDFSTAFPISLHSNHTLVTSALNIPDITANNNTTSSASSIDQKPFIHDSNIEPQFSPMIPGGSPRLRPPWMGEHSGSQSTASPNFPGVGNIGHSADGSGDRTKLFCDICQKKFITEQGYKGHMNSHLGIYRYTCPFCQKGCASRNQLDGHINMHQNKKPHTCEVCGKGFAYVAHYREHKILLKCKGTG
ncbi:B-cell lymphoma 6 protein homolog isoform X5 [Patella vulgata]|uniref:B-cell lymphoma 6 protein homolog isoform X5 n=1 Tax=Patella vulgata TaxID=6465 RepID=UPI00217FEE79|nr:B-cell lymphoma 6 protein homolog isoform X5 [Patella vulgata]XP_055959135.1 B-cell lymphoma 6 protein homolog isoform X5 [Patella vulgata]